MNVSDYLIEQQDLDWPTIVSDWHWLLPKSFTIWLVNRYGDLFLVLDDGTVHMLDIGNGTLVQIASSQDDFSISIDVGNNANDWLMIPLVDACVTAGLTLSQGNCYGFKVPPALGGEYTIINTEIVDIAVHFSFLAQIHQQTVDLPDGTKVNIVVGA